MSRFCEEIVGYEAVLSIGEPWDFTSSNGQNALRVQIDGVVKNSRGVGLSLTCTPFDVDDRVISSLIAFNRYVGDNDLPRILLKRRIFKKSGYATANFYENADDRFPVLIGGIELTR